MISPTLCPHFAVLRWAEMSFVGLEVVGQLSEVPSEALELEEGEG